MVIVTEWDEEQKQEVMRSIPDNQDQEEYKENWQLRNTKVLDANLQAHTDIQHVIPERRVYLKGSKWKHDMTYTKEKRDVVYVEDALQRDFHEISGIWCHGGIHNGIYEKYFCIHRTKNLAWSMPTQTSALWP